MGRLWLDGVDSAAVTSRRQYLRLLGGAGLGLLAAQTAEAAHLLRSTDAPDDASQ